MACHGAIVSAHFAPPCGTSSKARERPLPPELKSVVSKPLRSSDEPLGISGLTGLDSIRVAAANKLYALTVLVATILILRGASISIENPSNSYFWAIVALFVQQYPWLQRIWATLATSDFQACMYGSERDKWTKLMFTPGLYEDINKTCDGTHVHSSWKPYRGKSGAVFPTSGEKEYPKQLCSAMTAELVTFLGNKGVRFVAENFQHDTTMTARHLRHHGKKPLPPLMAEYWLIGDKSIAGSFSHSKPIKFIPKESENGGSVIDFGNMNEADKKAYLQNLERDNATLTGTVVRATRKFSEVEQWFGVWRTPEQSVQSAANIHHPIDMQIPLPDLLLKAIAMVLELGPQKVVSSRAAHCRRILDRSKALREAETELHSKLDPQVAAVLKGKNILLWKELLVETEFPDLEIVDEVMDGIRLVGTASTSQAFPRGVTAAQQSVKQLQSQAVWRRRTSVGKCNSSGDVEADHELWRQSLQEAEDGWLEGPFYSEDEVSHRLGLSEWICTRRFPLKQSTKVRLIDDGLESGLNSAFSCYNKLSLMDMDAVVALAHTVLHAFKDSGEFHITLSDGSHLTGRVHCSWGPKAKLLGRTLDLKSAYKELAVSPDQNFVRALVAYDPVLKRPAFFIINALPFGATSSVYSFNRVAKSLWHIMVALGGVWATQYYDDYPNVELASIAQNSRAFMEFILQVLGWRFASEGKKAEPHGEIFRVLGVEISFEHSESGSFVVANKADRISELVQSLGDTVKRGKMTSSEAASLHGQLNFAQGQYYGCSLKPAMVFLQRIMKSGWQQQFHDELVLMSTYLVTALRACPPRTISTTDSIIPVMVYTDGAYEPELEGLKGSAGLVVVDYATNVRMVQAIGVSEELLTHWGRNGAKQLIAHLELWPVLVFLEQYSYFFRGRRTIFYIDNNSVRDALIKDSSPNVDMFCMLAITSLHVSLSSLQAWFTRIASFSNPADAPSRGKAEEMARLLDARFETMLEVPGELSKALLWRRSFVDFMKEAD